jgi:tetratricopeptide (TPR) repeat protein
MERINKLQAMLLQQPADAFLQHALALELIKLGDDDAARHHFENLLAQHADYVGAYYHLGKLLERRSETAAAVNVFEQGLRVAKAAKDQHSYNELQGALSELIDE